MLNYLQNCQLSTPIARLADIINHNNQAITDEFNWIYDSETNRITKSVYVPTGSVKAHFGEFVNLSCEYLTIKNAESIKPSIVGVVKDLISENIDDHNVLSNRFSNPNSEAMYKGAGYAHDADAVAYSPTETVGTAIDRVSKQGSKNDASITSLTNDLNAEISNRQTITSKHDSSISYMETLISNMASAIDQMEQQILALQAELEEANKKLEQING